MLIFQLIFNFTNSKILGTNTNILGTLAAFCVDEPHYIQHQRNAILIFSRSIPRFICASGNNIFFDALYKSKETKSSSMLDEYFQFRTTSIFLILSRISYSTNSINYKYLCRNDGRGKPSGSTDYVIVENARRLWRFYAGRIFPISNNPMILI